MTTATAPRGIARSPYDLGNMKIGKTEEVMAFAQACLCLNRQMALEQRAAADMIRRSMRPAGSRRRFWEALGIDSFRLRAAAKAATRDLDRAADLSDEAADLNMKFTKAYIKALQDLNDKSGTQRSARGTLRWWDEPSRGAP